MPIQKSKDTIIYDAQAPAKITKMGNITDIVVSDTVTFDPPCVRLSNDQWLNKRTGEIIDATHIVNRKECYSSLRKTMNHIREIINTNVTDVRKIRWITLTYADNMTDTKQLYHDYERFWKRFAYHCRKHGMQTPEYITVIEPQGRGAWHIHGLFIWQTKAPYVPNDVLAKLWRHGYVSIKQPQNCDNMGAYFVAYLTDIPLADANALPDTDKVQAYIAASIVGSSVDPINKNDKKILKGARLAMYPPGTNIIRHSRGIKYPEVIRTNYQQAMHYIRNATETYCQSFEIIDDKGKVLNRITKASYNSAVKKGGDPHKQPD